MPNGLEPFGLALVMDGLPQYEQAASRVSRAQAEMGRQAESAAARTRELGAAATQVGFALAGLGAAGLATARGFVMTAARAEELDVVLARVAMGAGVTVDVVEEQREAIKALGITHNAANQILMRLVQSNIDLTNATKIARAAQDLAVIGMRDSSATALDLAYAIASGNVVILRKYGIMLNLRTMLSTVGTEEERLTGKVNVQARSQLVMNALFQQAERVSGSYTAAMSTASKQLRSMARYTEEIARTFGEALLPILSKVVQLQTKFSKILLALPPEVKAVISITLALGAAFATAAGAAILLVPRMDQWLAVLRALPGVLAALPGAFASFLISPMGLVAAAAAAMGAAVIFNIGGMQDALVAAVRTAKSTLGLLGVTVREAGRVMVSAWQEASQRSNAVLRDAGEEWAFHLREAGHEVEAVGRDISRRNFGIEFDPYRFAEGAAELMAAFASGLLDGLNRYVIPAIVGVVQTVADFLLGMSPPKVGPLSEVITGGAEVIRQWLLGMSEVSLKGVADIAEDVTAALRIPAFEASEALRELVAVGRSLDDVIRPIEDDFRRIQAAATIATYPLREQQRLLNLEIADLEEIVRLEDEKKAKRLAALTDQIRLMDEVQSLDRARMRDLDREIAIEERAAAKGDQSAQQRLRELKAQRMEMASSLEVQEEQRRELQLQAQAETDAASEIRTEAQKELTARELRRREIESAIAADRMMVAIAREQLELARALQIEDRIALERQVDSWRRRQEELQAFGSMAGDVLARYRESLGTASAAAGKEAKKALDDLGASAAEAAAQIKKKLEEAFDLDPKLEAFKERMAEIFAPVTKKIAELRKNLDKIGKVFSRLGKIISDKLGPVGKVLERIFARIDWGKIVYYLGLIVAFVAPILALKVVWAALGVVIAALTSTVGLVLAAVALLAIAWSEDFLEMQTTLRAFWEETVQPALQELRVWLEENIPIAIEKLKGYWETTLLPALERVRVFIVETLIPAMVDIWNWISENLPIAIEKLKNFWETTLLPALERVGTFFTEIFIPTLVDIWNWISENLPIAIERLKGFWETTLLPALEKIGTFVVEVLVPALADIWNWISENLPIAIEKLKGFWETTLLPAMKKVGAFITDTLVPAVKKIWTWLKETLPPVIEKLTSLWKDTLLPAIEAVWKFIVESLIPTLREITETIIVALNEKLELLREMWEDILLPAIKAVWAFCEDYLIPLLVALADVWLAAVELAVRVLQGAWENVLLPALRAVWGFLNDTLIPLLKDLADIVLEGIRAQVELVTEKWDLLKSALSSIWEFIKDHLSPIFGGLLTRIADLIQPLIDAKKKIDLLKLAFDAVKTIIEKVTAAARTLANFLRGLDLGPFEPGSITPFEEGLRGISAAMKDVVAQSRLMGALSGGAFQQQMIASMPTPRMVALPTPASSATRIYNISRGGPSLELTAHYAREQTEASIRDDVAMMLALA